MILFIIGLFLSKSVEKRFNSKCYIVNDVAVKLRLCGKVFLSVLKIDFYAPKGTLGGI